MNYELVKKLKEAGWPQKLVSGSSDVYHLNHSDKDLNKIYTVTEGNIINTEYLKVPLLSELVEACGEDFDAIFSGKQRKEDGYPKSKDMEWRADATNRTGFSCSGSTPEEAIANLWLALNK